MLGFAYSGKASSIYQVDDNAIETVLSAAKPVVAQFVTDASSALNPMFAPAASSKNVWVAAVLCWFFGGIAVHRVYLGAKGAMIFYYIITGCGIFGLVPTIDFIVLLINNSDISKYVGSNKYFMW
ncbi:hypothetical protein WSM22_23750 [Cytophagales bacterium WSM2-2]|nr:hypothetical protein WSM22_23750 [Cytophagales bacterium WSM2-2]